MNRKILCRINTILLLCAFVLGAIFLYYNVKFWPRYPKPEIYPGATNIQKFELPTSSDVRITTFEVVTTPDVIFSFYADILQKEGWNPDLTHPLTNVLTFGYLKNGVSSPAYTLWIEVTQGLDGRTQVKLTQILSGPFTWPEKEW